MVPDMTGITVDIGPVELRGFAISLAWSPAKTHTRYTYMQGLRYRLVPVYDTTIYFTTAR